MTSDVLANIKASAAGKSPAEIAQLRRDIAAHIRDLEPHLKGNEIARRFGSGGIPTDMQAADQQAARIERHKAEVAYLDGLLRADPILAAQAAAS